MSITTYAGNLVCRAHLLRLVAAHVEHVAPRRLAAHGFGEALAQRADLVGLLVHRDRLHVEAVDRLAGALPRLLQLLLQTLLGALLRAEVALPLRLVARMGLRESGRAEPPRAPAGAGG